jgi:hypothetical protein
MVSMYFMVLTVCANKDELHAKRLNYLLFNNLYFVILAHMYGYEQFCVRYRTERP